MAITVGYGFPLHARGLVCQLDLSLRHNCTRLIGNGAGDQTGRGLRMSGPQDQQHDDPSLKRKKAKSLQHGLTPLN
jgi:hypothetical protein